MRKLSSMFPTRSGTNRSTQLEKLAGHRTVLTLQQEVILSRNQIRMCSVPLVFLCLLLHVYEKGRVSHDTFHRK